MSVPTAKLFRTRPGHPAITFSRVASAAVLIVVSALVVYSGNTWLWLVLLLTVIVYLPPVLCYSSLTNWINSSDSELTAINRRAKGNTNRIARYFVLPLSGGSIWIWARTSSVGDDHLRAGVRAGGYTVLLSLLLLGISISVALVLGFILYAIVAWIFLYFLSDQKSRPRLPDFKVDAKANKIVDHLFGSRIVREGMVHDHATGLRIDDSGAVLKEGLMVDESTGICLTENGDVIREGILTDHPTNIRVDDCGQIVQTGTFPDIPTELKIDSEGRVVRKGVVLDQPTGIKFKKDG
jgi:hypothetical protein